MADLTEQLKALVLCNTEHPADAVSALMRACALILHPTFGLSGSIDLIRGIVDDFEATMVAQLGPVPGETAQ
jgi:hypothetical protein